MGSELRPATKRKLAVGLVSFLLGTAIVCSTIFSHVILLEPIGIRALYILHLFAQLGLFALAWSLPSGRKRLREWRSVGIAIAAYAGAVWLSGIAHGFPGTARTLEYLLVPWTAAAFVLFVPAVFEEEDYEKVFRWILVLFGCISGLSLVLLALGSTSFLGQPLVPSHDGRGGRFAIEGLFMTRNIVGSYLAPLPALACWLGFRRGFRPWHFVVIGLVSLHLLFTFSRSSQLVALIDLAPVVWMMARGRKLVAGGLAIVAFAAFTGLYLHLGQGFDLLSRNVFWVELFQQIHGHWLVGFGLLGIKFHGYTLHNVYLSQLGYFGIIGIAAFLALLCVLGREIHLRFRKPRIDSQLLVAMLAGGLAQAMVEYFLTYPLIFSSTFFWLISGALFNTLRARRS